MSNTKTLVCTNCGNAMWKTSNRKTTLCRACGPRAFSPDSPATQWRRALEAAVTAGDSTGVFTAARALAEVDPETGCWVWTGYTKRGYPVHRSPKVGAVRVHRLVLEAKLGHELGVNQAHHACANRACINPDHLQSATQAENTAEMLQRRAYEDRIAELEAALGQIAPGHPALRTIRAA
jgi:hypothetical protein